MWLLSVNPALKESVTEFFFRPCGARAFPTFVPTPCGVGCILSPLRGFLRVSSFYPIELPLSFVTASENAGLLPDVPPGHLRRDETSQRTAEAVVPHESTGGESRASNSMLKTRSTQMRGAFFQKPMSAVIVR